MGWIDDGVAFGFAIYLSYAVHKPSTSTDDVADEFRKRCRCHYVVGVNGFAKSSFAFTTTSLKVEVCFWPQFIDSVCLTAFSEEPELLECSYYPFMVNHLNGYIAVELL